MSSAMKNGDNPLGWTTTVIICKRWIPNPGEALLIFLLDILSKYQNCTIQRKF